ncbi:MAG: M24 family metallopeptidase, partial [Alphaproteobacteria bacterium]|nr:M24 family metallopeptidase [Alphaproteobacteria bacterium]
MDIKSIQKDLKQQKISGCLFTLGNLFINEDILPEENIILKLTGFSGSYAILFITPVKAYLFVDGRYEIQAKKEITSRQIEIVKLSEISFHAWLKKNFANTPARISYNPWLVSLNELQKLSDTLPKAEFIAQKDSEKMLCSKKVKAFPHQKKFTGRIAKDKIADLIKELKKQNLDAYLITSAANVSWLLNLRSDALPFTPILRAYALIEKNGTYKIFAEHTENIPAYPFNDLSKILSSYHSIASDYGTTPAIIKTFAPNIKNFADIITYTKAVKNSTELKGIKNAHLHDGVALTKFMFWLSKNYKEKTEVEIADKLRSFRQKELNFFSESFATIAGFAKNSAIVHYHATAKNTATLKKNSILLLDSGGQYYDGTTDVTRTIALGKPTPEMIEKNTLVLKAHIALASAIFPENTCGNELDLIARQPLLKQGLNYEHGTGHGVGFFS